MSGIESMATGIVDGTAVPAIAKVPANFRVTASGMPVGVLGDVITFSGTPTVSGTWTNGSLRVTIGGLPVINQSSTGVTVLSVGSPGGPPRLQLPITRVQAT
jgi:uncharacterized Zn-binding protein involved in type VI secretion